MALFLAADGKSDLTGKPLGDDWHADHIVPFSKGGVTDVINGQALTRQENITKSNFDLRDWQKRFIESYNSSSDPDYMLAALPGGGKTIAALSVAKTFIDGDPYRRRLIIVVPTCELKRQWRKAANRFGINLQSDEFHGNLKSDFHGVVITYQAVATNAMLFRALCAKHDCLVIFDEIHHAGDNSSWGKSIQSAFEVSRRRLCLTGTPFRTDGNLIPFLPLDKDGSYKINFRYDYPSALQDKVVRSVVFRHFHGAIEYCENAETFELSTNDDLSDDLSSKRLRGLLSRPEWVKGLLKDAHDDLMRLRVKKPDAGALAICINKKHAQKVAQWLEEITGEYPDVVVSDEDITTTEIDHFKNSNKRWIVAVRMVSEGVDIPRLMVLAYLTTIKTELTFRQSVGRILRRQGQKHDTEAYCHIPDDPDLAAHASVIKEFQLQVLKEDDEQEKLDLGNSQSHSTDSDQPSSIVFLSASAATLTGLTIDGSYEQQRMNEIRSLALEMDISETKAAAIIDRYKPVSAQNELPLSVVDDGPTKEERMKKLRTHLQRVIGGIVNSYKKYGDDTGTEPLFDYEKCHIHYSKKKCNTKQADMSEQQLNDKLVYMKEWLASFNSKPEISK